METIAFRIENAVMRKWWDFMAGITRHHDSSHDSA